MSRSMMASRHRWIYIGSIVLLIAMVIVGVLTFTQLHRTNEANRKADQLNQELAAAGYPTFPQADIARTLGTDGGPVCTNPNSALKNAQWLAEQANGAAGPGIRPVIADRQVLQAGALVIKVYCPDQLQDYQDRIDDLKTGDTVR